MRLKLQQLFFPFFQGKGIKKETKFLVKLALANSRDLFSFFPASKKGSVPKSWNVVVVLLVWPCLNRTKILRFEFMEGDICNFWSSKIRSNFDFWWILSLQVMIERIWDYKRSLSVANFLIKCNLFSILIWNNTGWSTKSDSFLLLYVVNDKKWDQLKQDQMNLG